MPGFYVTVKVEGNEDYCVKLSAADEWKARTRAMMHYPYKIGGKHVEYVVEPM